MTLPVLLDARGTATEDANRAELQRRTGPGWKDLTSSMLASGMPPANAPTLVPFGVSGLRREYQFGVNDYCWMQPFHVNHDIKIGGRAYLHVHWSSNGTSVGLVKWEFHVSRALGHNQANFPTEIVIPVEQAGGGSAWRHMVAEVADEHALILTEPDELILVTLKRVAPSAGSNADTIFGLTVDLHYESDRDSTPNKSPNFYV